MPRCRLLYHLVWSTRAREPLIGDIERTAIANSFAATSDDLDLLIFAAGGTADHIHVVVSIPPKVAVSEAVRRLKGASAHAVNRAPGRTTASGFGWQGDYGALTFGDSALSRVVDYVQHQETRHAQFRVWAKLEPTEPSQDREQAG